MIIMLIIIIIINNNNNIKTAGKGFFLSHGT